MRCHRLMRFKHVDAHRWCSYDVHLTRYLFIRCTTMYIRWCSFDVHRWTLSGPYEFRPSALIWVAHTRSHLLLNWCVLCILKISAGSSFAWACITIRLAFSALLSFSVRSASYRRSVLKPGSRTAAKGDLNLFSPPISPLDISAGISQTSP